MSYTSSPSRAFSTTSGSAGWIQYCPQAMVRASNPNDIAWINGWITVAAYGPMMCAPRSRPDPRSASTLQKPVVSSIAQP